MRRILAVLLLALPMAVTISCSRNQDAETPAPAAEPAAPVQTEAVATQKSLYDRLGGEAAIKAVVDEFVANVGADTRINQYFANADLDRLKWHLVNQIGQARFYKTM
jgi:hemoglobin